MAWPVAVALLIVLISVGRWVESVRATDRSARALWKEERELDSWERGRSESGATVRERFDSVVAGFASGEDEARTVMNRLLTWGVECGWSMTPAFGTEESFVADGDRIERIPIELECVARSHGGDEEAPATRRWIRWMNALREEQPSIQIHRLTMSGDRQGLVRCRMSLFLWVRLPEP